MFVMYCMCCSLLCFCYLILLYYLSVDQFRLQCLLLDSGLLHRLCNCILFYVLFYFVLDCIRCLRSANVISLFQFITLLNELGCPNRVFVQFRFLIVSLYAFYVFVMFGFMYCCCCCLFFCVCCCAVLFFFSFPDFYLLHVVVLCVLYYLCLLFIIVVCHVLLLFFIIHFSLVGIDQIRLYQLNNQTMRRNLDSIVLDPDYIRNHFFESLGLEYLPIQLLRQFSYKNTQRR